MFKTTGHTCGFFILNLHIQYQVDSF